MKKALLAVVAAFALTSCAEDMGYGPYFGGDMAYYDDFYGPFYNGYWAPDGFFYYSDANHHFHRDVDHHFHRDNPGGAWRGVHTHPGWVGRHGAPGGAPGATTGGHDRHRPH